ncbi:MAG: hypothetical protein JJT78_07590 [Leptospira sp.]|nr:hypothetical protein [Leptospira sp.]
MIGSPNKKIMQQHSGLLWKSIERQSEVQAGLIRLNKEVTLRILSNRPTEFLEANRFDFSMNMKSFLKTVVTMDPEKLEYFIFRVYDCYMRELQYRENRNHQFSMDILFQVIETLTLERESKGLAEGNLNLGAESLTKADLDNILNHIKAFNLLSAHFQKIGNIKKTIEYTDVIILKTATLNPMVTVTALDNMFSLILAQNVLATKYAIRNLLSGWMEEYGFSKEQVCRIIPLFPQESSLNDFRTIYSKAMQSLVSDKSENETKDMDLFILRTVCNYFTSWLNRVASQMQLV